MNPQKSMLSNSHIHFFWQIYWWILCLFRTVESQQGQAGRVFFWTKKHGEFLLLSIHFDSLLIENNREYLALKLDLGMSFSSSFHCYLNCYSQFSQTSSFQLTAQRKLDVTLTFQRALSLVFRESQSIFSELQRDFGGFQGASIHCW